MNLSRKIKNALISIYHKNRLDDIVKKLHSLGINIFSTGGTAKFIRGLGVPVTEIAELTNYPSILGGRVKTLHPKIFGGILARREEQNDLLQLGEYEIPPFDLVIVDLYPFQETIAKGGSEQEIIEKIDIGGISLIRAGAKNFRDVVIIPSRNDYEKIFSILENSKGETTLEERKYFASRAFQVSSSYDSAIRKYFSGNNEEIFIDYDNKTSLRYGENPHQQGYFYGNLNEIFGQLHGKELSYNNLVDVDSTLALIQEFQEPTFVIIKHTNPCGVASRKNLSEAWDSALESDPLSAFGGVIICNGKITKEVAEKINRLFFEILIAQDFENDAMEILKSKKNRILLQLKKNILPQTTFRSILNGVLVQNRDSKTVSEKNFQFVTEKKPSAEEISELIFANKVVKHVKSNAIVISKNKQIIGVGCGQTSRVDAVKQAIAKAKEKNFNLKGSVLASDAFFPFPDSVKIASAEGIRAIIQPGGSVKDKDVIASSNERKIAMVFTGFRHFKH